MKKWFVLAMVLMMVAGVQAAKGKHGGAAPVTKETYLAEEKAKAEAAGQTFDPNAAEAAFAAKDKNSDGVLTADELAPGGKKGHGKKGGKTAE